MSEIGLELAEIFNLSGGSAFFRIRHRFDLSELNIPRVLKLGKPLPLLKVLTYAIIQGTIASAYEHI